MASGVAKAIRNKWPKVYESYMASPRGKTMLGMAHLIPLNPALDNLFVVNCYTQNFYGYGGGKYADPDAIRSSLKRVYEWADYYDLDVYLPKIGAGLGGLNWEKDVLPIIKELDTEFSRVNFTFICEWE